MIPTHANGQGYGVLPPTWRNAALTACGLVLLLATARPGHTAPAGEDPPPQHPGPDETRAELAALCEQFRRGDDPIFGDRIVEELQERLQQAAANPRGAVELRGRLAYDLRRLGRFDEALALLEEARRQVLEHGMPEELRLKVVLEMAITHLRAAEVVNCVHDHTAASCILPIAAEAVHRDPAHARRAAALYRDFLARRPGHVQARWLLNLAAMVAGDYPEAVPAELRLPAGAFADDETIPPWRDVAPELGVNVMDLAGGAVMDDFDGDGLLDLITSTNDPCGPLRAFRNDGRGGFEDVTERWGLEAQLGGLNLVHGDVDGDGALDLLVLRGGWWQERGRIRNSLLRNDIAGPTGRFVDVTAAAGLAYPAYPTQTAAFADYDGDGDLDLYVGNEATADEPYPSQLFRNDGGLRFTDVTAAAGVANVRYAKGVAWGDYDDDGHPDLYVSNIGANRLYRNNGDGTFTDVAPELGVTEPALSSFATWFFDCDNDGDLDLFVTDYAARMEDISAYYLGLGEAPRHPRLYRNDGGVFTDVSREVGLTRPALPMGANYGDLDNDGWLDVYLGTGIPDYEALMPNLMLVNRQGRFRDVTFSGGFGHLQKGHGVAFGDLDNDGDQDLFHQLGGQLPGDAYGNALFVNPGNDNHWLTLRLEGRRANRFGVGARIEVRLRQGEETRSVHLLAGSGGSFGGSSLQQEVGLGGADAVTELIVRWPGSGTVDRFTDVALDRVYRVVEGDPELYPLALPRITLGTATSAHDHHPGSSP
ncbi:MAG TPA: CRTAC1 family protein [Thermoanaerobaculia bacterium]|nr:CRTAC1 family protein [Thermoanaerobaculia bacterium]